jgi:hypothetical protein
MRSAKGQQDQASTLRQMFGAQATSHALDAQLLCCPQRPAAVLPLAELVCKALTGGSQTVALADEMAFSIREAWPLKTAVRFDLAHCLSDTVPLANGLANPEPDLWFGYSRGISNFKNVPARKLAERLDNSGIDFHGLIVCAAPDYMVHWRHYGETLVLTLVCGATQEESDQAIDWLLQAARSAPIKNIQLLFVGAQEAPAFAEKIAQSVQKFTGLDCLTLGHVHADLNRNSLGVLWSGQEQAIAWVRDSFLG